MGYFTIIFLNYLSCIILISNGLLFKKIFKFNKLKNDIIELGIYGILTISIITFILNFFLKISPILSLVILFSATLICFKSFYLIKFRILKTSLFLALISSMIMFLDNTNRPDAGLYHLPYINIINDSKIIFGLANLEFRYGHASILQYLSAAYNNQIFSNNGILIPLANIFAFTSLYLFNLIKKNKGILKVIFFLFLFNIFYAMNRYSGFGNDDPAHIFLFVVVCNYLLIIFDNDEDLIKNVTIFSTFVFLIKPFLILVFLFPLFLLLKKKMKLFSKTNFFCLAIILLWFLKNLFVSSCIIYPEPKLCFKSMYWSTLNSEVSNPNRTKRTSEAWAKDWPNNKIEISQSDYIQNFKWLSTWKGNHFKIIIKEILPQLLLIMVLAIILPAHRKDYEFKTKEATQIFLIGFFSTVIWFLKFPIYRYGQGYIILLINSLLILFLSKQFKIFNLKSKNITKFLLTIIMITFAGIIMKNFNRINKNFNNLYVDYPWPKMNSFTKNNTKNENIPIYSKDNELLYYKPYPYTLCMNSVSPCTSSTGLTTINIDEKFGYKIYYFKNKS